MKERVKSSDTTGFSETKLLLLLLQSGRTLLAKMSRGRKVLKKLDLSAKIQPRDGTGCRCNVSTRPALSEHNYHSLSGLRMYLGILLLRFGHHHFYTRDLFQSQNFTVRLHFEFSMYKQYTHI